MPPSSIWRVNHTSSKQNAFSSLFRIEEEKMEPTYVQSMLTTVTAHISTALHAWVSLHGFVLFWKRKLPFVILHCFSQLKKMGMFLSLQIIFVFSLHRIVWCHLQDCIFLWSGPYNVTACLMFQLHSVICHYPCKPLLILNYCLFFIYAVMIIIHSFQFLFTCGSHNLIICSFTQLSWR
jgi:hypothetical protein